MPQSKSANESQIFHIQLLWMREQQTCPRYILLTASSKISINNCHPQNKYGFHYSNECSI